MVRGGGLLLLIDFWASIKRVIDTAWGLRSSLRTPHWYTYYVHTAAAQSQRLGSPRLAVCTLCKRVDTP